MSNAEEFGDWLVDRARRHHGRRRRAPAGAAVAARDGRQRGCSTCSTRRRPRRPTASCTVDPELVRAHRASRPRAPTGRSDWQPRRAARPGAPRRRAGVYRPPARPDVHRPARPRGPAAGDHLHLQPRRLRRRRRAVPARRAAADHRRRARPRSAEVVERRTARPARRATWTCSATGSGATAWSAASPPTTPGCCRRSRRPSRSCSSAAWSRPCSPPRPSRSASTCPPAPSCSSSWSSSTARRTPTSRRGSTPSSPAAPAAAASTSRATPSCSGSPGVDPRAGRRSGLDPHLPAALARFQPTLQHGGQPGRPVRPRRGARELLEQSFAQFQADRSVVGLARQVERNEEALAGYAGRDALPPRRLRRVRALRRRIARAREGAAPPGRGRSGARPRRTSLEALRPGDVIAVPARAAGRAGRRARPGRRPTATTRGRWCSPRTAGPGGSRPPTSPTPVEALGRMRLPKHVNHRAPQCAATSRRRCATPASSPRRAGAARRSGKARGRDDDPRARARCAARCARTPATAAPTARSTPAGPSATHRLERETEQLRQKVEGHHEHARAARSTGSAPC